MTDVTDGTGRGAVGPPGRQAAVLRLPGNGDPYRHPAPAALTLFSHALAPLAELPVLEIVSGTHIIADLTLGLGKVVHDYLA